MKRRVILSLIFGVIAIVLLMIPVLAPPTSTVQTPCVSHETVCLQLSSITGTNLEGVTQTFPSGFTHPYQLVVMPFDRDQQTRVLDFVPLFQELSATRPDLGYYSLAALPDLATPIRLLVTGGMTALVSDPAIRQAAYIFYLSDQAAFLEALGLDDISVIRVFIFDQAGDVLWQSGGDFTPDLAAEIRAAIEALPRVES